MWLTLKNHVVLIARSELDTKRSPFWLSQENVPWKTNESRFVEHYMPVLIVVVKVLFTVLDVVWESELHL